MLQLRGTIWTEKLSDKVIESGGGRRQVNPEIFFF